MTTRTTHEAALLVLAALAVGSQHGSGIITDVREISGGRVRLRAGTLYTALDRLRADGLIGVDRAEIADNRLRRYYRLTHAGVRCPPGGVTDDRYGGTARPELRIGDAEREAAVAALGEHFARGRLTLDEFNARLDVALTAATQGEMSRATWDLPHATGP